MNGVSPVLKKLLIVTIVIYVIGTCYIQTDLYAKVGAIELRLMHMPGGEASGSPIR